MNNKLTILLFISLFFNLLFFLLSTIFISKQEVRHYLKQKFSSFLSNVVAEDNHDYSVYYQHKKSQFAQLSKSKDAVIFLGDSITDEGEWVELLGNSHIKNRGISGDTTDGVLNRLDEIVAAKPRKIFLMIGVNDLIFKHQSIENTLTRYKHILKELQNQTPTTEVFIQSVLPVNNKKRYLLNNENIYKFNIGLKDLAKEFNYQYIDVFSHLLDAENQLDTKYTLDGLHLNGQGYFLWKKVIEKYLE